MVMQRDRSKENHNVLLAIILIVLGVFWLLMEAGLEQQIKALLTPFSWMFSKLGRVIFSWPMVMLVAGLIMVRGRHLAGWVLAGIGMVYLIPRLFDFVHISTRFMLPLVLLIAGLVLITKRV